MKYIILLLLFIVLSSNECNMPYRAKTICPDSAVYCDKLTLKNSLEINFRYASFDWRYHRIDIAIFCEANNPGQLVEHIDRTHFSVVSSRGIEFESQHMQVANDLKTFQIPDEYPLAPGQTDDYVFIYSSKHDYSKSQGIDLLKNDTVYFLYKRNEIPDTLFKIVAGDKRMK